MENLPEEQKAPQFISSNVSPSVAIPQKRKKSKIPAIFALIFLFAILAGFAGGSVFTGFYFNEIKDYLKNFNIYLPTPSPSPTPTTIIEKEYVPATSQEEAVIKAVKEYSPAVVSIIISKDLPVIEQYYINPFGEGSPFGFEVPQYRQQGTQKQEVGGGSGFIISSDGLVLTNKHVVQDKEAEYTVLTTEGKKYPAKVLALDPVQDLALIKIDTKDETGKTFPTVKIGDSDNLQIGQTVIAIGNALGEFRNTVSVGVISGLGRTVTASSGGTFIETIEDVVQTDAAINKGNSGGPLLNLKGEVIGVNTAMAQDAQSIGFAIPINKAKRSIEQVKNTGKITYPFLGVRYVLINAQIKEEENLTVDYGAWIKRGDQGEEAVTQGSAAQKAGLIEGDIILEFNGEKITTDNSLAKIIMKYSPGDTVNLKILRSDQEKMISVTLGERSE